MNSRDLMEPSIINSGPILFAILVIVTTFTPNPLFEWVYDKNSRNENQPA